MARERDDFSLPVGPNRTTADTYRTGYVPNPNVDIANSELRQVRELPIRRARLGKLDEPSVRDHATTEVASALPAELPFEPAGGVIYVCPPSKSRL